MPFDAVAVALNLTATDATAPGFVTAWPAGDEVNTAGDGFLALFDGPTRAIQCAIGVRDGLRELGREVRAGVLTGEVERPASAQPRGIALHFGARIAALAGAGEILVSATTHDLVAGSGVEFDDRGDVELRGFERRHRLFSVKA